MLETLVAPRIRRTLFEYALAHPHERFYLRGLAKALDLPISPLRRELKRLERAGMLSAAQEGNILFYTVNGTSPTFLQLQRASQPAIVATASEEPTEAPSSRPQTADHRPQISPEHSTPSPEPIPVGVISPSSVSVLRHPLDSAVLVGATVMGMALVLIVAATLYGILTKQGGVSQMFSTSVVSKPDVTIANPPRTASSGVMHGSRWQLVPGGVGGFSSSATKENR